MKFLTAESDLLVQKNGILYFYTSDQAFPISEIMFPILYKLDKSFDITCIDLSYFKKLYKRFDIDEIPTLLVMKSNSETKRITGIPSSKDIDNIFRTD